MATGFFQEKEGVNSIMRLNTSLLVWAGLAISIFTVLGKAFGLEVDAGTNFTFAVTLIGIGITGKFVQKFGEK